MKGQVANEETIEKTTNRKDRNVKFNNNYYQYY